MVAQHGGNVESIVILGMEKEIIVGCGDCALMAQYAMLAPPPAVVAIAVAFVIAGGYALPPLMLSLAALAQQITVCL